MSSNMQEHSDLPPKSGQDESSLAKPKLNMKLSVQDQARIKKIINIPTGRLFPRCPGKALRKVSVMMKKGDDTHRDSHHLCEKCRCEHTAGYGTRGDFYGLGEQTGHFGVGYCYYHEKELGPVRAHEFAVQHLKAIQSVGDKMSTATQFEEVAKLEAKEVEKYNEMRRGLDLVITTLKEFESIVSNKGLTEYVSGPRGEGAQLADASDVTRMDLALRIAKTLTGIKLDEFRMRADEYIHIDELAVRLPKMIELGKRLFAKERELIVNYKEGERNPLEYIESEWKEGMKGIWQDAGRKHAVQENRPE